MRVKNCFAFSPGSDHVELLDALGCPTSSSLMTQFAYNYSNAAEAMIPEMFKFPNGQKLFLQCDVVLCRGGCQESKCETYIIKGRESAIEGYAQLTASTTVYVVEPSDEACECHSFKESSI